MTTLVVDTALLSLSATLVHVGATEMATNAGALTGAAGALGNAIAGSRTADAWFSAAQHADAAVRAESDGASAFGDTVAKAAARLASTESALGESFRSVGRQIG